MEDNEFFPKTPEQKEADYKKKMLIDSPEGITIEAIKECEKELQSAYGHPVSFFNNMANLFPVNKPYQSLLNEISLRYHKKYEQLLEVQNVIVQLSKKDFSRLPDEGMEEIRTVFFSHHIKLQKVVFENEDVLLSLSFGKKDVVEKIKKYVGIELEKLTEKMVPHDPIRDAAREIFYELLEKDFPATPNTTTFELSENEALWSFYIIFYRQLRARGYEHNMIIR